MSFNRGILWVSSANQGGAWNSALDVGECRRKYQEVLPQEVSASAESKGTKKS